MPFFLICKDNLSIKEDEYGLEEMTFTHEEEVFPVPNAADTSVEEVKHVVTEKPETKPEAKRKQPEKPTEKKVHPTSLFFVFSPLCSSGTVCLGECL